jgi:hypothetical protein
LLESLDARMRRRRFPAMTERTPAMPKEIAKTIGNLRKFSSVLSTQTDDATRLVAAAEKFLTEECAINVPAQTMVFRENFTTQAVDTVYLQYRRIANDGFRIVISRWREELQKDGVPLTREVEAIPWQAAERVIKLRTVAKLPDLLATIHDQAETLAYAASTSTAEFASTLKALEQS